MDERLPLLPALSQVLVAFVLDVDNEIERRLPHFTSSYGSVTPGFGSPWLISLAMWATFLRYVGDGALSVRELTARAGISEHPVHPAINGMVRWGFVHHHPDPADGRAKPPKRDWLVTPTANGRRWHAAYPEVLADVERSWEQRSTADAVDRLRSALTASISAAAGAPPRPPFLPLLDRQFRTPPPHPQMDEGPVLGLVSLLAHALLAPTLSLERTLPLALPLSANVVRVVAEDAEDRGVTLRDLPLRTGVAKQAVTTMLGVLQRSGHAVVEDRRLRLTESGRAAHDAYRREVRAVDDEELRVALRPFPVDPAPRFRDGGWRAHVPVPDTLPHHPVVLGHGGYPDGS